MRIVLIGVGAIGGSIAACLKKENYDITVVAKHTDYVEFIQNQGLSITGVKGTFIQTMTAVATIEELEGFYDIALVATKAYDVKESLTKLLPFLKENSSVVSLQNGICTDIYEEIVGKDRSVGCVVGYGSTMTQRGHIEITSTGNFVIGAISKTFKGDLNAIKQCLSTISVSKVVDNIYEFLYSKLIINSCITSLGAITGITLGEMMQYKSIRNLFLDIIKEAIAVAISRNIQVPPYGGKLNYYKLYNRNSKMGNFINHLIIKIVGKKYRHLKSSSLQSLERGQKTEIDFFNGYIAKLGTECNVPTPLNKTLVTMIKEIENKKRTIDIKNIEEIHY